MRWASPMTVLRRRRPGDPAVPELCRLAAGEDLLGAGKARGEVGDGVGGVQPGCRVERDDVGGGTWHAGEHRVGDGEVGPDVTALQILRRDPGETELGRIEPPG